MTRWQPIESAPKDGTPILVTVAGGAYHASKAHWDSRWQAWVVTDAPVRIGVIGLEMAPTHWMRLPDPPVAGSSIGACEQHIMEGGMTDRQTKAVMGAIHMETNRLMPPDSKCLSRSDYTAQAAIAASDARFVPGLVMAIKEALDFPSSMSAFCFATLQHALAQLPEEYSK